MPALAARSLSYCACVMTWSPTLATALAGSETGLALREGCNVSTEGGGTVVLARPGAVAPWAGVTAVVVGAPAALVVAVSPSEPPPHPATLTTRPTIIATDARCTFTLLLLVV